MYFIVINFLFLVIMLQTYYALVTDELQKSVSGNFNEISAFTDSANFFNFSDEFFRFW